MTPLYFRVLGAPPGASAPPLPSFAAAGTIGRSEGNTLVLADPSAQLSRQHCRLEPGPAGWQVVDLSSNGTFVNDMLVGRGNVRPLRPGDRLRLGDWQFLLEGSAPAAAQPGLPAEADPHDPFGIGDISRAQAAPPVHAPLPPRADAAQPLFGETADPFGPGAAANPFGGGGPGPAAAASPFGAASARPDPFQNAPPLADPFGAPPAPAAALPDVPSVLSGGLEQMSVPLPTPAGAAQGGGLPDDWMDEALAGLGPKPAAPAPPAARAPAPPPLPPPPEPAIAAAPPKAPRAAAPAGGGLAAFAQGAGIAPPAVEEEAALAELGRANRLLARSLMRLLAARRAVKSEFRISQTVVAATENNPLKFSADEAEMVALLLGVSRPGFQAGAAAVADATRDLEAHQVALLAAFRAVVGAMFARLDPAVIGGREDDAGLLGRLTGGAKGAAWDAYVKAYADMKQDFSESLRGRLAQVFAEAYEAESRRHGGS
jgi:type VI secretion system FHA domain protein